MAKNWTFTFNNYTEFVERHIKESELFNYLIYGHEVAPTTGTIHLQGFSINREKEIILFNEKITERYTLRNSERYTGNK